MASVRDVKYITPLYPRQIRLDTTLLCQAWCLTCHRHGGNRKGEMSFDLIDQILDDVSEWEQPLEEICPVNYGEFFMREEWFLILNKIAHKLPYTMITLASNGMLLDEKAVALLCKIPTFKVINFSINAYYDETYSMFMGLPTDNLVRIKKAITLLRILRPDIRRKVSMVFSPEYQTDLERDLFQNFWYQWAEPWVIPPASAGRRGGLKPYQPVLIPCRSLFSDIVIGYDGKLSSCCFDSNFSLSLGSYSGDIRADWNNEELTELRRKHNEGERTKYDICRQCTFS